MNSSLVSFSHPSIESILIFLFFLLFHLHPIFVKLIDWLIWITQPLASSFQDEAGSYLFEGKEVCIKFFLSWKTFYEEFSFQIPLVIQQLYYLKDFLNHPLTMAQWSTKLSLPVQIQLALLNVLCRYCCMIIIFKKTCNLIVLTN